MITDGLKGNRDLRPFLFRFAQPIPDQVRTPMRYDSQRQVSQVLIEGKWVDGPDAIPASAGATTFTRVHRETTDDA